MIRNCGVVLVVSSVFVVTSAFPAFAGATPEQKCHSSKMKEWGKFAACRSKAQAKFIQRGDHEKFGASLLKCQAKLDAKLAKIEALAVKKGGPCPDAGSAVDLLDLTLRFDALVENTLAASSFIVVNGDGTVTDLRTGLMWEQKTDDGSVHDVDNRYTWSTGTHGNPDGTVFSDFLVTLNGGQPGVGNCARTAAGERTGGFAGYCDWRLPTIWELQTLNEYDTCATPPCFSEIDFGPTPGTEWWFHTASSWHLDPTENWRLAFGGVAGAPSPKIDLDPARAVRGGSWLPEQ